MRSRSVLHSLTTFPLAGGRLNRLEKERKREGFLAGRLAAEAQPSLLVCRSDKAAGYASSIYVAGGGPGTARSWLLPLGVGSGKPVIDTDKLIFVGEDEETRYSIFVTSPENVEGAALAGGAFVSSRVLFEQMSPQELTVAGTAVSIANWAGSYRFCPGCGGPLRLRDCGMSLQCTACGTPHFPRINPAMIVCVLDGKGNVLLSQRRQQSFQSGAKPMRTILAGFVAHGESMEDTVAREVLEEAGAAVTWVRYVGTQPWPFPFQLMGGYYALAEHSPHLVAEEGELLRVDWVSKEEVRQALAGTNPHFCVPQGFTSASVLLSAWVEGRVNDRGEEVTSPIASAL